MVAQILAPTPENLARAVTALQAGQLVAFPTETVYGLGADAANPEAVRRIFTAKGRPASHPVIVHLEEGAEIRTWAREVDEAAWRLAEAFWPGPLTLILRKAPGVTGVVTGGQDTVGLRVPDHPVAQALLARFGGGIAAPSANRFGRVSPTRAEHVAEELGDSVEVVLDGGQSRVGLESTIVDLSHGDPVLLRPGAVSRPELEALLGRPLRDPGAAAPRAPGRLPRHYAPLTPVRLLPPGALPVPGSGSGVAVVSRRADPGLSGVVWRQLADEPGRFGRELYATLRDLDRLRLEVILLEQVPAGPRWEAVRDRLQRASEGRVLEESDTT